MGLLKYNNQTYTVEGLPDGLVAIESNTYGDMQKANNAYLTLKSRIPIGVDESQLGVIIEKGLRFDTNAQELTNSKTTITDLTGKLSKFSDIPPEFSKEQWSKYVQKEQTEIRQGKISKVAEQAREFMEKEWKVKVPTVDPRFLNLDNFNPDDKDAVKNYAELYDNAHTEQEKLLKSIIENQTDKNAPPVGINPALPAGEPKVRPNDVVGDTNMKVQHF
jgi:hypothetical protein